MQAMDVWPMAPTVRHETIFDRADQFATGETRCRVHDNDPLPLRYQLEAMHCNHRRTTHHRTTEPDRTA
jgi:uncharacterized protein (DUF2249 family)